MLILDLHSPGPQASVLSLPAAGISHNCYNYTEDLLTLSASSSASPPQTWPPYKSPIKLEVLSPFLCSHSDQAFAAYIRTGLQTGFRIGFTSERSHLRSRGRNHPSAQDHREVIDQRIYAELSAGRLLGPISPQLLPGIHTSPLGLVPKSNQPGQWRLICDLSSPAGTSVNDGIPSNLCSLRYSTVDDAVRLIQKLGRGSKLVKLDIKDAYRIVPVHPDDYHLLGVKWEG